MPEIISGQSPQTLQNPQGHSVAASTAGQVQSSQPQYGIGAFNTVGVDPLRAIAMQSKPQQAGGTAATSSNATAQTQVQAPAAGKEGTEAQARQLTEKDERHFAQFVTKASQKQYELAKALVEADSEAIFKIAETDRDLADRLVKEFDFGEDTLEALLEKKTISKSKNPLEAQKELEDSKWKAQMEKDLMEEKIRRLKGEDPDLNGEVEEKFREIYSDKAFAKYDELQKIGIAKTLSGRAQTQSSADNVALAILQREQGVAASPKGAMQPEAAQRSADFKNMQRLMGVTDTMLEALPSDIETQIASALGGTR